jgi:hypothetical protein
LGDKRAGQEKDNFFAGRHFVFAIFVQAGVAPPHKLLNVLFALPFRDPALVRAGEKEKPVGEVVRRRVSGNR